MILDELFLTTFIISVLLIPYGIIFNKFSLQDPITRFFILNLIISIISREWEFSQLFLACILVHSSTKITPQKLPLQPKSNHRLLSETPIFEISSLSAPPCYEN